MEEAISTADSSLNALFRTLLLVTALTGSACAPDGVRQPVEPALDTRFKYLAFQLFVPDATSSAFGFGIPPATQTILQSMEEIREEIGDVGKHDRRLAVFLGPLSLAHSAAEIRATIQEGFDAALLTDVAVGLHIDDSMFWDPEQMQGAAEAVEWTDYSGMASTGRRLDWSSQPIRINPQLCFNCEVVRDAVRRRAHLIGEEVALGMSALQEESKEHLFAGVIAGWETQIGRDFETGLHTGFRSLSNAGFSEANPPQDMALEMGRITTDFIEHWSAMLAEGGAPADKIYSHIAYVSNIVYDIIVAQTPMDQTPPTYGEATNWTPPEVAFAPNVVPGFSSYPQPGQLEQLEQELSRHGDAAWVSAEGAAIDPAAAEMGGPGVDVEVYLGNRFNRGAIIVNIFGWGVGAPDNPFRMAAESDEAKRAYRKFLEGAADLNEALPPIPNVPPAELSFKVRRIQELLPGYISIHGSQEVQPLMTQLQQHLDNAQFDDALAVADELLALIDG